MSTEEAAEAFICGLLWALMKDTTMKAEPVMNGNEVTNALYVQVPLLKHRYRITVTCEKEDDGDH